LNKDKIKTIIIFILIIIITAYLTMSYVIKGRQVIVPNIKGLDVQMARNKCVEKHLYLKERETEGYSVTVPEGCVMAQDPVEGAYVKEGRTVYVTVSKGLKLISVPNLQSENIRQSKIRLEQNNLMLGKEARIGTKDIPEGDILAQNPPPNALVRKDSPVSVLASSGERDVYYVMPNLVGKKYDDIRKSIYAAKMELGKINYVDVSGQEKGVIVQQSPLPGVKVKRGSQIDLSLNLSESDKTYRMQDVLYSVPKGGMAVKRIKLVIIDNDGSREIYNDEARSGTTIEKSVKVCGEAILQIYINNEFIEERKYE